jgi:4-amino-4-deoxy-L-arabinose transferase-like glycosyltransferase
MLAGKSHSGYLHALLVAVILVGVLARFSYIGAHYLNGDEEFYIVAAQKFHAGSDYDVRLWNYHAPPVAKYLMSLSLAGTDVDYSIPYAIPPNLWVWNYVAYESIGQVYPLIRYVSAVIGTLFIVLVFLIGKELFGKTAGLWAAASAAISIDYIMLSRAVLVDMFLYAFIASTIFFYIKYRKTGRAYHLLGFFVSLILMFGSKNAQWVVVIPPLLYVEIAGNKKRILKTINFLIVMGAAWFIHSSFVYPPEFSQPAYEFFTGGANKNIIEPHLWTVFKSLISVNSYFYLAVFAFTAAFYLAALGLGRGKIGWTKIKRHLLYPTPHTFLLFVAIVSLGAFSLTSLSINSKYIGQTSIPFFVLGGFVVTRLWKRRPLQWAFVGLLIVGAFSAVWYFPSYEDYPGQQVIRFSSPGRAVQPYLDFLNGLGNPRIVTNNLNLLLFYPGEAIPIPVANSPSCTPEFLDSLRDGGYLGVFKNVGEDEKRFLCRYVFDYKKEIGGFQEKNEVVEF